MKTDQSEIDDTIALLTYTLLSEMFATLDVMLYLEKVEETS